MTSLGPIRREVLVDADPGVAFRVFTERIGSWWPVAAHSVHGEGGAVTFDGNEIVEVSADGHRVLWGVVTEWQPGERVAFTWHPSTGPDRPSHVSVTFAAADGQTLVSLIHDGWEVFADPADTRAEYDEGWPRVLASFAAHITEIASAQADDGADTWVALLHRPGPNAPSVGSLFAAPGFHDHLAFLSRMRDAGLLVAAGPLLDAGGEGMTVLRLPGANRLDDARQLATQDDASVASGFFTVEVRPWQVMLQSAPSAEKL
jgi:uncharacterized protein YciI/uncharacterized protein YndB with AHSA1/START domain